MSSHVTRRAVLSLALAAPIPLTWSYARADRPPITWQRDDKDPRWVQGQAIVSAAPDDVWSRIQRVDDWPNMFSDIKWIRIIERAPNHWRVRLESNTMTCGSHDYHVRFDPNRTGRVIIDAPGTTSVAYFRVLDGRSPAEARVVYSLFVDIRGIMSWFVSEKTLRDKQEQMVVRYLRDIDRLFNGPLVGAAS
jgi:hypothetical protein